LHNGITVDGSGQPPLPGSILISDPMIGSAGVTETVSERAGHRLLGLGDRPALSMSTATLTTGVNELRGSHGDDELVSP